MLCCCNCKTCTHRRLDSTGTIAWSDNVWPKPNSSSFPPCPADIVDMQARAYLYILAERGSYYVVQKWTLDGEMLWSVNLTDTAAGSRKWLPARIDSDDTSVWVCGPLNVGVDPSGGFDNFYSLSATNGTTNWSTGNDASDIEPDGSGGVFYGHFGGTDCAIESGTENGYVVQLNSIGTVVRSFGGLGHAYSLLVTGSKLWVGSNGFSTECFCTEGPVTIEGCLARYSLTGTLELFTGGGTWVDSLKDQTSLLGSADAYVNRLALSPDGHILCGLYNLATYCLLIEFRADTGALVRSFDLSDALTGDGTFAKVESLACTSSTIGVVAGQTENFLYLFDESATKIATKRHRGYLTGTTYMYSNAAEPLHLTEYNAVTATTSAFFAGGTEAGCTPHNDDADATPSACDAEQECECGDFNTRGQAVVGCGCEDGVDPTCEGTLYVSFTGCLANMPSPLTLSYVDPSLGTGCDTGCDAGGHQWNGTIGSFQPFPDLTLPDQCALTLDGTVTVCYDCTTGWSVKFCITNGGIAFATFSATTVTPSCSPPTFTFTFDGTFDYLSATATACCDGTTGCGGVNQEVTECPIESPCCTELVPATLTATLTSSACSAANGQTITIAWNGAAWLGDATINGETWSVSFGCNGTTSDTCAAKWSIGGYVGCQPTLAFGESGCACDPFSVTFITTVSGGGCVGCVGDDLTVVITA